MKHIFALLLIFFLSITMNFAQDCTIGATVGNTCTFAADGTLTIPSGVDLIIEVKAWGAGGGTQTAKNNRHGGGGGAYFNAIYSVTSGATFPIVVGQGVVASAGGDTSFDIDGGGDEVVGGGGLGGGGGSSNIGLGGTGPAGSVSGGNGGNRETNSGASSGGGGGGSGPGNGNGGNGGAITVT